MFTKLKESVLFKHLSAAFCFDRETSVQKTIPVDQKNAGMQKTGIMKDGSHPDAVWNRSKLARYRRP